jgi:hypothetical protein
MGASCEWRARRSLQVEAAENLIGTPGTPQFMNRVAPFVNHAAPFVHNTLPLER